LASKQHYLFRSYNYNNNNNNNNTYKPTQTKNTNTTMTGSKAETAALAASTIACADQIMLGVREHREGHQHDANSHYVKAAIAGAIAIGAYALMEKDENKERDENHRPDMGYEPRPDKGPADHRGHMVDLAAEAAGAYALGRQMMGHKNHAILKLITEGLGAAALGKEIDRTVVD